MAKVNIFGGNEVTEGLSLESSHIPFHESHHYNYNYYSLQPQSTLSISNLSHWTIFLLSAPSGELILTNSEGKTYSMSHGDVADMTNQPLELKNSSSETMSLLVAGIKGSFSSPTESSILLTPAQKIKKVQKPWGHELWINTNNSLYCLKEVFVKAGTRTSLQYHRQKVETNVVLKGDIKLYYKNTPHIPNDEVGDKHISSTPLKDVSVINVSGQAIHRIEALSDVYLYEVSTPHLDDVIRLQDDSNRINGRIESEHVSPQVIILTAGVGSRVGELSNIIHKGLLPVKGKALLSHIIEKFPPHSHFIIAVGYKSQQIESYVKGAHPDLKVTFVEIDVFEGAGSGPGYSLLQCKQYLKEGPFYFTVCDAFYEDDIPMEETNDWVAVSRVEATNSAQYCNFKIENDLVTGMLNKEPYESNDDSSFVGLCYISNTEAFWNGILTPYIDKGEYQMVGGIRSLIDSQSVKPLTLKWWDVGNLQQYKELVAAFEAYDFSKSDEFIYFVGQKVIKFFNSSQIAENRVRRAKSHPLVFPHIHYNEGQFYAYDMIPGETFYLSHTEEKFNTLLSWLDEHLWNSVPVDNQKLIEACRRFYKDKTDQRIALLKSKYPELKFSTSHVINGKIVPSMDNLLSQIDWNTLISDSKASVIHGDLQFDNILYTQSESFKLIDWRQDFAGEVEFGDLYYDFAKLEGGLILNYDLIKENRFQYTESEDAIELQFDRREEMDKYQKTLEEYILSKGYKLKKVKLLIGLIFLNMAPLHHYPFDKFLFFLASQKLHEAINENQ